MMRSGLGGVERRSNAQSGPGTRQRPPERSGGRRHQMRAMVAIPAASVVDLRSAGAPGSGDFGRWDRGSALFLPSGTIRPGLHSERCTTYVVPCTVSAVKTITITITEELDESAAVEAKRRGISKSELIRLGLEALLPVPADLEAARDPWLALAGFADPGLSAAPGDIDDIVYGS